MAAVQRCTSQRRSSLRCNIHCTVMGLSFFISPVHEERPKGHGADAFPQGGRGPLQGFNFNLMIDS